MFTFIRSQMFASRIKKSFCPRMYKRYCVTYEQGQSPEPGVREYFYYVDHQGMLFLDDARIKNFTSCFKDKKFLAFFFKRLKSNNTRRYAKDFPFVSFCGPERNFVRCDDLPIVFTKIVERKNGETGRIEDWFGYAHVEELLMVPFQPEKLYMNVQTGRVYHPAPEKVGGIGLVRSKIAIEISSSFNFEKGENYSPTHFTWKNEIYVLDTNWCNNQVLQNVRQK